MKSERDKELFFSLGLLLVFLFSHSGFSLSSSPTTKTSPCLLIFSTGKTRRSLKKNLPPLPQWHIALKAGWGQRRGVGYRLKGGVMRRMESERPPGAEGVCQEVWRLESQNGWDGWGIGGVARSREVGIGGHRKGRLIPLDLSIFI